MPQTTMKKAGIATLIFFFVSFLSAVGFLAWNNWFGAGDITAFIIWSIPPALFVFLFVKFLSGYLKKWNPLYQFISAIIFGIIVGYSWVVVGLAVILGPWLLTFSFPIVFCWMFAAVAAFLFSVLHPHYQKWPLALGLASLLCGGVVFILVWLNTPPPALTIYPRPNATEAEIKRIWNEVLSKETDNGFVFRWDEISSVLRMNGGEGNPALKVSFRPRTSKAKREQILEFIFESPLVGRIGEVENREGSVLFPVEIKSSDDTIRIREKK